MIRRERKRLAVIAVVAVIILVAVVLTWCCYLSPAGRADALTKIRRLAVYGLVSGAVYALLALGFTLIYGVAGIVNMAHGGFYMLGAYVFFAFEEKYLQLDPLPAVILAVVFLAFVGMIIYRIFIHPVIQDVVAIMVVTLGAALIFENLVILDLPLGSWTVELLPLSTIEKLPRIPMFLGVTLTWLQLIAIGASAILITALWIFIRFSKIGKAMRAVAQDREVALLMGINTERLYMLTMAISAALAVMAAIFNPFIGKGEPSMWTTPLAMSFAIVILGGLGSIKGSLIGAFIIGYAEKTVTIWTGMSYLEGAASLAVMVLILLLRPAGLFGKRLEVER